MTLDTLLASLVEETSQNGQCNCVTVSQCHSVQGGKEDGSYGKYGSNGLDGANGVNGQTKHA
jgi:hypothetical protein